MMNSTNTQTIQTTQTTQTTQPIDLPLPSPSFTLDPANPLVWILVTTTLLSHTDEIINAIANLIRAIASLRRPNSSKPPEDNFSDQRDR